MAIKFQYNKTSLQALEKQLQIRERALPTLKNKESALRVEVKRARDRASELEQAYYKHIASYDNISRLWGEFDQTLIQIKDVELSSKKIAGVFTPVLEKIIFETNTDNLLNQPVWFPEGITIIKKIAEVAIEREVFFGIWCSLISSEIILLKRLIFTKKCKFRDSMMRFGKSNVSWKTRIIYPSRHKKL